MLRIPRVMRYLIAAGICLLLILAGMHISAPQSWQSGSLSVGAAEAKSDDEEQYNLSSIVVLTRVISYIKNYYFDPARIDPQKMFKSALEGVARSIPSVMVDFDEVSSQVRVRVDTSEEQFNFGDVNSVWKIQYRLSEIFRFLQPYLESGVDPKDVEFSAINGMLDTLDPHSIHMTPSLYRDLKMSTVGNFGGLGIQIGIREGKLTTIAPLRDTPAWRAGMKSNDHIQRIDGQSTVNMSLDEAVRLMRGKRGTGVKLTIMRKGWSAPKTIEIIRDIIPINSIHHKLLPGKIGFIQISNFQGNTVKDLKKALAEMKRRGNLQGLILDLRINPGGLLDSAVKVSDLFLDSGTIVTTVGAGNERLEMSQANFMNTEEKYPIAVLISSSSASASEIVAGALKNNNRAVLIGERTFGKGSVQVLYDMDDGSALKLTVAQYLTPGDVSIQSVGVVPDISLMPVLIEKENIEFYSYEHMRREKDLEHHLDHKATVEDKPFESLHYLYDEKRDEIDIDAPLDAINTEDFIIQFAYKMLRNVGNISRREIILQRAVSYLKQVMQKEDGLIVESLKKMGIDWGESAEPGMTQAKVEILSNPKEALKAGEAAEITLKVTNTGKQPFVRLRAMTESDNLYLDSLEFFLGRVDPGKTGSWKAKITIPEDMRERADDVVFKFYDQGGSAPASITRRFDITSKPGPDFAYTFQIIDDKGNGDGLIQKDEMIELLLNIENIGEGPVVEGLVILKNTDNLKEVFIHTGRAKFDAIKPGERAPTRFVFQVKPEFTGESFPMEILSSTASSSDAIS